MAGRWNKTSCNAPTADVTNFRAAGPSSNQSPRKISSIAQISFSSYGVGGTSATPNIYVSPVSHFEPVQRFEPEVERIAKHIQSIWATCECAQHNTVVDMFIVVIYNNLNYINCILINFILVETIVCI